MWPEGVFADIVRKLDLGPSMELSRSAERAQIRRNLAHVPGFLRGKILNVSRSGAMVETDEPLEVGYLVYLLLSLAKDLPPHAIQVRVCWVEKAGKHFRMGLEFIGGLTEKDGQHIDEFVRPQNTIDVQKEKSKPPRPFAYRGRPVKVRPLHGTRVDYFYYLHFHLTPKKDMQLPYKKGDLLEVRFLDGKAGRVTVEVTGHDAPKPGILPRIINLKVRELTPLGTPLENVSMERPA